MAFISQQKNVENATERFIDFSSLSRWRVGDAHLNHCAGHHDESRWVTSNTFHILKTREERDFDTNHRQEWYEMSNVCHGFQPSDA